MALYKKPGIILFLKVPTRGSVKTRLISEFITELQACELQIEMIRDTLILLSRLEFDFQPVISYFPANELAELQDIIQAFQKDIPPSFFDKILYVPQLGKSVGEHFATTFTQVLELPFVASSIILAGDTPHISSSIITQSLTWLISDQKTAVIGPSQNGGFYLYGINRKLSNLSTVFSKENEFGNLFELSLDQDANLFLNHFLFDIDTLNDVFTLISVFEPILHSKKKIQIDSFNIPINTLKYIKTLKLK